MNLNEDMVATAVAELLALHTPRFEEVECWADEENGPEVHAERFPDCPGNTDPYRCEGHSYEYRTCSECGVVNGGDETRFRPWPCATLRAFGLPESSEDSCKADEGGS